MNGSSGPSRPISRRRVLRALASGVLTLLLASTAAAAAQGTAPPAPPAAQDDFAGLVDIGGRRLYLECRGAGSPTVMLEAGYRDRGDIWSRDLQAPAGSRPMVLPAVAGITRVCAYDRPGTASEPDPALGPPAGDDAFIPSRS